MCNLCKGNSLLYTGEGVSLADGNAAADAISSQHPGVDVEVLEGGQQLYPFIASAE